MEDIAVEDGESAWPHPHPSIKRQILLKRDIQYEFLVMELRPGQEKDIWRTTSRALLSHILDDINAIDSYSRMISRVESHTSDSVLLDAVSDMRLRDLRRLEYQFGAPNEPTIFVKRHSVLFIMDPVRAIIMSNRVIVMVPDGADNVLQTIETHMLQWNRDEVISHAASADLLTTIAETKATEDKLSGATDRSPNAHHFESHAYETLMTTVLDVEDNEFKVIIDRANRLLSRVNKSVLTLSVKRQEEMQVLKEHLQKMASRIQANKRAITELLDDDERMALMNLTKLKERPSLYRAPLVADILNTHEETEDLFELYLLDYSSLETKVSHLQNRIESAEALVLLRLDTQRNELLTANTSLTILSCAIAMGAYFTGVFGMNLDNTDTIQHVKGVFAVVFSSSFLAIFVMFFTIVAFFEYKGVLKITTRPMNAAFVCIVFFYIIFIPAYLFP